MTRFIGYGFIPIPLVHRWHAPCPDVKHAQGCHAQDGEVDREPPNRPHYPQHIPAECVLDGTGHFEMLETLPWTNQKPAACLDAHDPNEKEAFRKGLQPSPSRLVVELLGARLSLLLALDDLCVLRAIRGEGVILALDSLLRVVAGEQQRHDLQAACDGDRGLGQSLRLRIIGVRVEGA